MKKEIIFYNTNLTPVKENDSDMQPVLAYGDVRCRKPDTDSERLQEQTVCRVWMMKKKNGMHQSWLVDWWEEKYKRENRALETVEKMKEQLIQLEEERLNRLFCVLYGRYQIQWMLNHKCTVTDLIDAIQLQMDEGAVTVEEAFDEFERDSGFDGEIWASREEFRDSEWKDEIWVRRNSTASEYVIWKRNQVTNISVTGE